MELLLIKGVQMGGAVAAAILLFAIYKLLQKNNKSNESETAVYTLLVKEVARLSSALEEADKQLKELRKECNDERIKCDIEIAELRATVRELKDKLIGDN